ncbi:alpha/beta hydrolase [Kitasatospora sp. RB6PN24]|uniref:alpha/beta fold hydrolase n=1 Tax=Kitasatospora humi TaxID=2893891 RepID=UPI001E53B895|nr:alpha/beta hydrolase [Kitasatospora humi]MCC9309523.1 alpha/beta hydrolase [Kitasatospora humi]
MTTTGLLKVPGAALHHEHRGSGPVLLLIPGGAGDAGLYAGLAERLAAHWTVVGYDPRGLSRSPLDGPLTDQRVEVWSDDARRLLDLYSPDAPAAVFGSSSGAIVALDLLARHPERVWRVVAHEPPLLELLADPTPYRTLFAETGRLSRTAGPTAAMAHLGAGLGGEQPDDARQDDRPATELPPEIQEMAPRMAANMPVFLERMLHQFATAELELAALHPVADRLALAAGRDSRQLPVFHGPAARLAELLGAELVEFPGGHLGSVEHPAEFAEVLHRTLR